MKKIIDIFRSISFIAKPHLNKKNKFKALLDFFKWQLSPIINRYPIIYQYTENSKLIALKGLTGATGSIYCGLDELNDMGFLLHFLRKNDLFVDIGANIGSYTVLASAEVGAFSLAFEPHPATF